MFLNESEFLVEKDFLKRNIDNFDKDFSLISENFELIQKGIKEEKEICLEESELDELDVNQANFVQKATEFIQKEKRKAKDKLDTSKTLAFIGLGVYFLGIGGMISLTSFVSIVGVLLMLISLIISIASLVKGEEAIKIYKKLITEKEKLEKRKKKVKSKKEEEKIEEVIDSINIALRELEEKAPNIDGSYN